MRPLRRFCDEEVLLGRVRATLYLTRTSLLCAEVTTLTALLVAPARREIAGNAERFKVSLNAGAVPSE